MAERAAGNTHRLSELQRDQILKHCHYFDLEQTGRIDSELLLRQLACYIMVEMCPDDQSDPALVHRLADRWDELQVDGGIEFDKFISVAVPALCIPAKSAAESQLDDISGAILALANAKTDVVVMEHDNPELEGKIHKLMLIVRVNDLECENKRWEVVNSEIRELAKTVRPLTIVFADVRTGAEVQHTFRQQMPLRIRWADRLKVLNDEVATFQADLLGDKSKSPINKKRRKDLRTLSTAIDKAHADRAHQRANSPSAPRARQPKPAQQRIPVTGYTESDLTTTER